MSPIKNWTRLPVALVFVAIAGLLAAPSSKAQTIPTNPMVSCTTDMQPTPPEFPNFASWFQSGAFAVNGVVKPADSLNFPNNPNCSFYQWAYQMFLWLTSPAPPTYCGGGAHVFDSTAFFDVSPPDPSGNRTFLAHACSPLGGIIRFLGLRAAQVGPHGLPMIMDKTGRMIEVETTPLGPNGKPLVRTRSGRAIEVQRVVVKEGRVIFLGRTGKPIPGAKPFFQTRLPAQLRQAPVRGVRIVQKFVIGGRPFFVDPFGTVVEVEQGQAGTDAVLEAQNGSLIYYGIHANDVYAYFLTAMRQGQISSTAPFPTTAADLTPITSFASAHGVTFPDSNPPTSSALALEVKTSWIEASTLPDPQNYITMTATVPTYNTSNPTQWTPNGEKTVQLALVGMHVVGSTAGHPEMIWATFEHVGNTPNDDYQYLNNSSTIVPVSRDTSGTWLFSASNSTGLFNQEHMTVDPSTGNINAISGFTISPSDTIRSKAWGGAFDQTPNPIDPTTAASNSEIISMNNSVRGQMPGDVRGNYILTGATWTIGGAAPTSSFDGNFANNEVGTSKMANSTMETYDQGTDQGTIKGNSFATGSNCFLCHSGITPMGPDCFDGLSHIFTCLQALSTSQMAVHVAILQGTFVMHKIQVTVLNSATGAPLAGANVSVSNPDDGTVEASGQTAANGTVTLQYRRCIEVVDTGELPAGPAGHPIPPHHVIRVPCDGAVQVPEFTSVFFEAP